MNIDIDGDGAAAMTARRIRGADMLVVLGVAVLYVGCAKLGLALAFRAEQVSAVWPPTGFALAALVLLGRRVIPGIFLGAFAANATAGEPVWVAAGVAAGNTLEAIVGAAVLARFDFDTALARLRDVLALFGAVLLAPVVSATIGVGFLVAGGLQPAAAAPALWPVWWLGDALGGLVVAPLIFVWSRRNRPLRPRGFLEPALMLTGVVFAGALAFSLPPRFPAEYLVYPFLIWSALRLGPAYTATAAVLANAIAVTATIGGRGPFAGAGPEGGLVLVQMFMAVGAGTALILGAVVQQSRAAHRRAEDSEQRLLLAMSGARVGVWEWNIGTGQIDWSEGLEPLHGYPPRGFAGTYDAYRRLIHPDDVERVESLIRQAVDNRTPYEAEFRLVGADGIVRWTGARGIVLEENGRPARMIGVGIDVTPQKELEEELRLQHRRKDEFLAMLGHELRNPLAAIVHAVALLPSRTPGESEEARRVIQRQTRNLSRLVDDLLDVARITRGQITLERRRLPLRDAVNAGVDVWRHLITQKEQRLTIGPAPKGLAVEGDQARLTQAFANLVHNASKFTPEGGTIDISMSAENGSAVLRVRDDGSGMTPDVLAQAFELFVQGSPSLDRQQGGLGLGLTLVRRLVEMHGGTVEASSAGPQRGSEVTVRLPLAVGVQIETEEPEPHETATGALPRRRILVVEDNPDARAMLVLLLRRDGHEVRSAGDGYSALNEAASFVPEIVFLDLGLPGIDGYEVAQKLRASTATAETLLVALTGYGQQEDRDRAAAAGFDHHLLKPVEIAEVLDVIAQHQPAAQRTEA